MTLLTQYRKTTAPLASFVSQLREIGGHPVLITALSRRSFVNGTSQIADTLGPWADETISVAEKTNTPLLDLHGVSLNCGSTSSEQFLVVISLTLRETQTSSTSALRLLGSSTALPPTSLI
jgi:hypothetical protein